ncbi:UDP-glycosyltransferase 79B9-like [Quercus lobata]|uniref:Glycosyltransferase n=1 Tax=Quercus lobata TaxID=97700 RepID=A0A7N2R297_QUELO|nr:UDP-glycosyltransferase 79B9-like [Quercus lobata]
MSNPRSTKLHIAMFPWFAFGHITPYLHLSNKLTERGHRVSFLLPKGAQAKVEHLILYPNLIHFYPLLVPSVDRLPPGAETASDVPLPLRGHLCVAFDQTQDQVQTILSTLKPDFIFFDFSPWMPALAHQIGSKAICYSIVTPATQALKVPTKEKPEDMTVEDFMQPPPGYPPSCVRIKSKDHEIAQLKVFAKALGTEMSLYVRITYGLIWSDALAYRTYHEFEGPYCDYLKQHYAKPVLLTGPVLPKAPATKLDEKWTNWLCNFKQGTVVYCAFGSQNKLQKDQFQELLLGFELCGQPFLVALSTPDGCATIEEAFPEGFEERVKGRGWVYGGWVPQTLILEHPSVGCSVTHCGYGSMWESLFSDCQIVCVPYLGDQIVGARLMVEELKVAVEVEREDNGWISKESLSKAIVSVMDEDSEIAGLVKYNHAKLKEELTSEGMQERYLDTFIQNLQGLMD